MKNFLNYSLISIFVFRLPGVKKALSDFGVTEGAAADSKDDDDDIDLFGSDDEVDEEAEKLKQDRIKAYSEKKSKSNFFYKILYSILIVFITFIFQNLVQLPNLTSFWVIFHP